MIQGVRFHAQVRGIRGPELRVMVCAIVEHGHCHLLQSEVDHQWLSCGEMEHVLVSTITPTPHQCERHHSQYKPPIKPHLQDSSTTLYLRDSESGSRRCWSARGCPTGSVLCIGLPRTTHVASGEGRWLLQVYSEPWSLLGRRFWWDLREANDLCRRLGVRCFHFKPPFYYLLHFWGST